MLARFGQNWTLRRAGGGGEAARRHDSLFDTFVEMYRANDYEGTGSREMANRARIFFHEIRCEIGIEIDS